MQSRNNTLNNILTQYGGLAADELSQEDILKKIVVSLGGTPTSDIRNELLEQILGLIP